MNDHEIQTDGEINSRTVVTLSVHGRRFELSRSLPATWKAARFSFPASALFIATAGYPLAGGGVAPAAFQAQLAARRAPHGPAAGPGARGPKRAGPPP